MFLAVASASLSNSFGASDRDRTDEHLTACTTDNECTLVEDICNRREWIPVSRLHRLELENRGSSSNVTIRSCFNMRTIRPRVGCVAGTCQIVKDRNGCHLADMSGKCITM